MKIGPEDYKSALDVQTAGNMSGIARSLFDLCCRLNEELHSTTNVREHPIVVLYVAQMAHLARLGVDSTTRYNLAYEICEERSQIPVLQANAKEKS